jgi:hypothetical protein
VNDPVNRTDRLGLRDITYPCPGSQRSCDGGGGDGGGNGWRDSGGDSFVGVSGERWSWGCTGGTCGLYPDRILNDSGTGPIDIRAAGALAEVLASYANGGAIPSAAFDYLSFVLSPGQLDAAMYQVMASNASPSQLSTAVGLLTENEPGEIPWWSFFDALATILDERLGPYAALHTGFEIGFWAGQNSPSLSALFLSPWGEPGAGTPGPDEFPPTPNAPVIGTPSGGTICRCGGAP